MAVIAGKNGENVTSGQIRQSVEKGMCLFCGVGPFESVLHHIARIHGTQQRKLREMIRVTWKQPLVSSE